MVPAGTTPHGGGPDAFGYTWIDSDTTGGPTFNWVDASTTGTLVSGLSDDNYVGPFPIGFTFNYYGTDYTQFYVCSNGFLGFGPTDDYSYLSNTAIPSTGTPNNILAWCWDDLYPDGTVYYQTSGNSLIVQFVNYGEYSGFGTVNAEIIISSDGSITYQYLNFLNGFNILNSTVGIENSDGTDGLQVVCDETYLHDNLAVRFAAGAPAAYATLPYTTGFEQGSLDQYWSTQSENSYGRIQVTGSNAPHSGSYHLTMDVTTSLNYSTNEAWLHLDLSGETQVDLSYWWKDFGDESDPEDGIFLSDDGGATWSSRVQTLDGPAATDELWYEFTLDVDSAAAANGLSLGGTFVIKFQQRDNYPIGLGDGFAFDDISVSVPTTGLVAYYPFNSNANDESGNGNDGTVYGPTLTEDRFGNANSAYSFGGLYDYIYIPTDASILNTPISQFSFQAWIKSVSGDGTTAQNVFEAHTQATSGEVYFEANMPAPMRFGITDNGGTGHQLNSQTLALNTWYQVVGTYNGSKQKIYVNGVLHDSLLWSDDFTITSGAELGRDMEGGQYFNGLIDDIRIYDRALSAAEIEALYYEGGWDAPAIWHVSTGGDDGNAGTATEPLRNIQTALNVATAGDTIKVAGGIYQEALTTSADVILMGGYDEDFSPTGRNLVTHKSIIKPYTGGMFTDAYSSTLDGFVLDGGNLTSTERAVDITSGFSTITHNIVINMTQSSAKGIYVNAGAGAIIKNNTVYGNILSGGGVIVYAVTIDIGADPATLVQNNIIVNNNVGLTNYLGTDAANYNNVYSSTYYDYNGTYTTPGANDIYAPPKLVNASAGDFRLKGGSPCIDAGNPNDEVGEEPEPNGGRINIGAYGGTAQAMPDINPVTYVSPDGQDTNDGSLGTPYRTIQHALENAMGDTIKVATGTYSEGLIARSAGVLLGGYSSSFNEPERDVYINNTTIQAVSTTMLLDNYGLDIDGFVFDGGTDVAETALDLRQPATISHNVILNVRTTWGEGIVASAAINIINNTIYNTYYGVWLESDAVGSVVKNNIISGNNYAFYNNAGNGLTSYNDLYDNAYGNYAGGAIYTDPGIGEISLDPLFQDAANGDFRLQATSPCIDRGDPDTQYNDPDGSRNDMGAYHYQQPVDEPPTIVSTSPAQNALNVAQGAAISVTFDMDMDDATITANTFVVNGNLTGRLSGNYSYDTGSYTATFTPDSPYKVGEQVSVTLTTGVQCAEGEPMASPYAWSFTAEVLGGSGEFEPQVTYPTGNDPGYLCAADLDGDGDLDLAVTNSDDNTVSILLNNGDGTFQAKIDYGTGYYPIFVFAADLDSDGDPDLAVTNNDDNTVSILLNNGNGTFQAKTDYGTGAWPWEVFCADLDGDGDPDLAVTNNDDNTISILLNNGNGTFQTRIDYGTGAYPFTVFCADLDGDSDPDLAVTNSGDNTVSILLNNGNGTFQTKTDYGTGNFPVSVFPADLDSDGDLDLTVVNDDDDNVSILLNYGNGTFQTKIDYGTGYYPISVFPAELDGDGDPDLAVTNSGDNTVSILLNNGNGTFQTKTDYMTGVIPFSVFCADLDSDGDLDVAVSNIDDNTVSVLLNTGGATANTQYISGTGNVDFPGTDLAMDFTSQTGLDTISVQAFLTAPDGDLPSDVTLVADRYWIITHSGSGDFSVDLTFNLGPGTFSANDQQHLGRLLLLQRDSGGTLPWEIESHGTSATDSTVTFADLTGFSQFVIGLSTDIEGPIISSEFRRVAQPDDLIEVDAYVRDPSGISSVKLHYLEGGSLVFDQADMSAQNDTTYRAGVPVASTVIRGLAYFIVGTDSVGNVTTTDTTSVPVAFPAGTFTTSMLVTAFSEGFPFNKWRLISIPCDLTDTSVTSIIQEVLGVPPSDETWKIFRYTGPGRDDYIPVGRFTSGESYFLKQIVSEGIEQPVHFTLGAGQSVDLTGQSILLPSRRWSFISSPYPFVVSIAAPDQGTFKGPYTYGEFGSHGQEGWSTGQVQTILRPWDGYIIYNNTDQVQTLTIRPPGLAKAILPKGNTEQIAGWLVKLTIEGERYFDAGNEIGRITGASDGLDSYDSPEPPHLEGYVSLTIENSDWEGELPRTSDIRSDDAVNGEWDLILLTRNETEVIDLSAGMYGDLPPQIVLIDLLERAVYDLKNDPGPISISDYDENVPYRLKVLAGEQGFVEDATDEILAQLPEQLALAQNYPNPFNPTTTIGYALPRPAKISLKIYNLLGQEIVTLVNDWQELGYYSVSWQGRDQAGQSVASGMYFAVLRVDERTLTRKMVLLR